MNENLILECLKDVVLEDATKRVLGNILTQFEDLSGEDHNKLVDINMDFLGNHIPEYCEYLYYLTRHRRI